MEYNKGDILKFTHDHTQPDKIKLKNSKISY